MLEEIERLQPDVITAVRAAVTEAERDLDFLRLAEAPFGKAPKISIDHAVMEKTDKAAVIPARFPGPMLAAGMPSGRPAHVMRMTMPCPGPVTFVTRQASWCAATPPS